MQKTKMTVMQLTLLTALNMLGSGIIMLPAKIAELGGIALLSWSVVCVAAIGMAYAFAYCGMYSRGVGGLGSIAQNAFGRFGSFITNSSYALSLLVANVAIATSGVGYFLQIFEIQTSPFIIQGVTIVMLWTATVANFPGAKFTGRLGAVTIWGIFIPIVCLLAVGPFYFEASIFEANWNPNRLSGFGSIQSAVPMMFWSFLGLESALANADSVENPEKSVPKAVLLATIGVAAVFVGTSVLISGVLPNDVFIESEAPFVVIFNYLLGGTVSKVFAFLLFLALWGSLLGWQFTMARVFKVSADLGFFPSIFRMGTYFGVPVVGILLLAFLQTLLVPALPTIGVFKRFDVLVDLSAVTNVFPYLTCMAAVFALAKTAQADPVQSFLAQGAALVGIVFLLCYFFFIDSVVMKFTLVMILAAFVLYGVFVARGDD